MPYVGPVGAGAQKPEKTGLVATESGSPASSDSDEGEGSESDGSDFTSFFHL